MDEQEQLERKVTKWAKMLGQEEKVEHAFRRLEGVQINLQLLSSTGVGKAVNALRKHPRWGERASGLVAQWKEVAKAETARAEAAQRSGSSASEGEEQDSVCKSMRPIKTEPLEGHITGSDKFAKVKKEPADYGMEGAKKRFKQEAQEECEYYTSPTEESRKRTNRVNETIPKLACPSDYPFNPSASRSRQIKTEDMEWNCPGVDKEREEAIGEEMDAFSAQLAAADKTTPKKTHKKKKTSTICPESIHNSLLDSISSPHLMPVAQTTPITQQSSVENLMFKAPKEKKRIYAGRRKTNPPGTVQEVPKLFDICMRFLLSNIDSIEETGDIPFDILRPVLEKANSEQLRRLEKKNPYLREDTDYLWQEHCRRDFATEVARLEEEEEDGEEGEDEFEVTWRGRYKRFLCEREERLRRLSSQIKNHAQEFVQPQRQAKLTVPIAPRYARKRQIAHGIRVPAHLVPSAVELTRARRQIFENGNDADLRSMPSAIRSSKPAPGYRPERIRDVGGRSGEGASTSSSVSSSGFLSAKKKPQRGPLMMKTLRMLKKQRR